MIKSNTLLSGLLSFVLFVLLILLVPSFIGHFLLWVILSAPIVLSFLNLKSLFDLSEERNKKYRIIAIITFLSGALLSIVYIEFIDIIREDRREVLYNNQKHFPIYSKGIAPILFIIVLGIIAYLILISKPAYKMPPLLIVVCMSLMYLQATICILWCIQLFEGLKTNSLTIPLYVLPINCLFIIIREIRIKINEWNSELNNHNLKERTSPFNKLLKESNNWPILAFVLMIPILGIIVCILVLFGQEPDILIKSFTETADWTLSTKIAPPNVMVDEHYLCTVAANGDKKIVKPLRMGERHGHKVVVNRQLQIANAFEQVLEERIPKIHKVIRYIYDKYGYPISKHIKTNILCDLVYILMKPLEWFFLIIIYFNDIHPEDRIARQYLPKIKDTV